MMLSWLRRILLVAGALAATALPAIAQQVTVERDTGLYAEPRLDSRVVTKLKQGSSGAVVGRNGAWLNIKTAEASGWLFSFNVRFAAVAQASGSSSAGEAAAVGRLFGPRSHVNVTSTIGVRGLEEDDLRQARFDDAQMRLLDQYVASGAEAEKRARESGLSAARVDYLEGQPQ